MTTERILSAEERRAREEAPGFAEDLARARARAQGVKLTAAAPAVPYRDRPLTAFADLVGRVCQVPAGAVLNATPGAMPEAPRRTRQSPGQWRIERYIPDRHRAVVLKLCPAPVDPTPSLPEGRCRCVGPKHFVPQNESQRAALESVCNFVRAAERGEGPALILVGPTGVGKSHLLWAACRYLNERDINAAGVSWDQLADTLRDAKAHPDQQQRLEAIYERDRYLHARALCLDEVRATAGTEFDPQEIARLTIARHDKKLALLMSSQQRGEALTALADSAATGRLVILEMTGENYRKPADPPAGLRAVR